MIPEERFQEAIKRWTALIEEYPQLSRAIRVDAASLKMGSIMCPECALHCSRRSVHNHMNSMVCVQRRETIKAIMEGYVEWYGATNSAKPFIKIFHSRIRSNKLEKATWVKDWWSRLWYLSHKLGDKEEVFARLARAYVEGDTATFDNTLGIIELGVTAHDDA